MVENVILVDTEDNETGIMEKLLAHQLGKLHRAFSIFIFDDTHERLLIQKRARGKYHSGGLWSNTCCSHPRPGEDIEQAAKRRLKEEMGFVCDVREVFSKIYKTTFDNGLTEYEFDYVYTGCFNGDPAPDPEEAEDWKWVNREDFQISIQADSTRFSYWFKYLLEDVLLHANTSLHRTIR